MAYPSNELLLKRLKSYKLDLNFLRSKLEIKQIRGSGKGGQKRNKTSSTIQIIDRFNYYPFLPEENKKIFKYPIVIKMDQGRSKESNFQYAIEEWYRILRKYFKTMKKRTINLKIENERKLKLKNKYKEKSGNLKYKNRYNV